jgi:hypothetical protein
MECASLPSSLRTPLRASLRASLRKTAAWFGAEWCLIDTVEPCDHARYARLRARAMTLFLFAWFLMASSACSHSAFERQHEQAVAQNPPGVELEIRTRGDRKQFAVSEPVEFEELYTSKYSGLWHIEILEGLNTASNATGSDVVHIADGSTILEQPREMWAGIICCDSRHVWLSQDPTRVPYKLSATPTRANPEGLHNPEWHKLHLPSKPGKYQVYLTTQRLFGRSDSTTTYEGKGIPLSSNVLKLEVK